MSSRRGNRREYTEKEKLVLQSGQTPILWKKSDEDELKRVVKNFNAKISRLEKKNPDIKNALPEKVTARQMKEMIDTRQDLKRELNSLKRFSERGAEKLVTIPDNDNNLKITAWQKKDMEHRLSAINRKRNKRREMIADIEMTDRGKKLGYKKGQLGMGKTDEVALKPMKAFTKSMGRADLTRKYKNMLRESNSMYWQEREKMLMENYIQSLEQNFPAGQIAEITDAIREMNFDEFYKVFQAEGGNFEESYPGDDEETQKNLRALKARWIPNKEEVS